MMSQLGEDRAEKFYRQKAESVDERTSVLRARLHELLRLGSLVFSIGAVLAALALIPGYLYGWDLIEIIISASVWWLNGSLMNRAAERVKNPRREDLDDV